MVRLSNHGGLSLTHMLGLFIVLSNYPTMPPIVNIFDDGLNLYSGQNQRPCHCLHLFVFVVQWLANIKTKTNHANLFVKSALLIQQPNGSKI